jgi:hypothetical protein
LFDIPYRKIGGIKQDSQRSARRILFSEDFPQIPEPAASARNSGLLQQFFPFAQSMIFSK